MTREAGGGEHSAAPRASPALQGGSSGACSARRAAGAGRPEGRAGISLPPGSLRADSPSGGQALLRSTGFSARV